ncbi:DNA methyltransferase [Caldisericum sp.]|uniref:DNA methyltransferase n=1 Tax=Caldisericum sp. TaxID=2499687 RepID=UPI003D121273
MTKEEKFYKALQDVFIGAKVEGEGGFINLMRIKSTYYSQIEKLLKEDIEKALERYPAFKDELFDKLYSFFSRYFTESGSIYFNSTPFHNNVYEKVYTDNKDVILFWKTQMLYYVKTDRIFRSLPVEFDGFKFYFDASKIENKKANEKRSLVFELDKVKEDGIIVFAVQYSERGAKTKQDEILKTLKRKGIAISEEQLERAFKVFEKQSEVDFFINKNAKAFLQEQFKLWSYQYFWEGAKEWSADRVNQLQILKDIAFKIIDFISQFEDELVKIWNKPKFVKNSNYVITMDRIKNDKIIEKILKHKNFNQQIKEWQELGIVDEGFKTSDVFENDLTGKHLSKKYEHLPIDTKYFKDLELEILGSFDDLDKSLDGWLIKSENYQALNTILPKFKEKVQTIYIDPPFNTGEDFPYVDRFQDSSWLSLINDRISISKIFLNKSGAIFVHLDHNAEHLGRVLLDSIFRNGFINNLAWSYRTGGASKKTSLPYKHDSILFFAKNIEDFTYRPIYERQYLEKSFMGAQQDEEGRYYTDTLLRDVIEGVIKDFSNNKVFNTRPVLNLSNEFYGFKTQKPEGLLYLLQYITSKSGNDIILDFFAGTGTSLAVAQKLNKKWIGIEMGEYINNFYIDDIELNNTEKNKKDLYKKFIVLNYKEEGSKIKATVKKMGILGRLKQVLNTKGRNEPCGISEDINWQGGGFFKYYELEQYEEALANCKYEDGDLFTASSRNPYQEYVFMKDEKMLKALEIDYENNKVKVDLSKLYLNIDIAETLSNLTGKWIKKISDSEVEFEDGTKINTKDLDYKIIKPLIWWE